ncbi:hypothetical protein [Paenirhodobacter hankyongi]|uniref:Uncharacterized protein n=1 Tax=Paenirhodobacter hankyongi TaxID=2294033 RepID=A0A421BLT2_9RHOB|nr:hypothetical protein [Sinirhodobacter hankyongi]RLL63887.1 hypothetical protein DYS74_13130 [Sinirhodobacter hankyongi]
MNFITPTARTEPAGSSIYDSILSFGGGLALLTLLVLTILCAAVLREWSHPKEDTAPLPRHAPRRREHPRASCRRT